MCIVFYRVFKSDLWSYMVNTDLLPATPSSWVLSCVVFLLGDNRTNSIDTYYHIGGKPPKPQNVSIF